jgi:hypothetical protein
MKRIVLLIILLSTGRCAFAQTYGRIDFSLQTAQGQAVSGAIVGVYSQSACGQPAGAPATDYGSSTGGAPTQPLITDGFGHTFGYFTPGCVTVVYISPLIGTLTYPDQNVLLGSASPGGGCTFSVVGATENLTCNGTIIANSVLAQTTGIPRSVYDATQYGAVGNAIADDTAAIQAAANTCANNGTQPLGGEVLLPGKHAYVISSTINMLHGCWLVGDTNGGDGVNQGFGEPVPILSNFPVNAAAPVAFTSFTIAANSSSLVGSDSPTVPATSIITINVAPPTGLALNQHWYLDNCQDAQYGLINRFLGQVVQVNPGTSFVLSAPEKSFGGTNGTFTGTGCVASQRNVDVSFDNTDQFDMKVKGITFNQQTRNLTTTANTDWAIYFAGRVDSSTTLENSWMQATTLGGAYFAQGTLNSEVSSVSRCDGSGSVACIYERGAPSNFLTLHTMSLTTNACSTAGTAICGGGAGIMIDNQSNALNASAEQPFNLIIDSVNNEEDGNYAPGYGFITIMHSVAQINNAEVKIKVTGSGVSAANQTNGSNFPFLVVSPASDEAVEVSLDNVNLGALSTGGTPHVVGVPGLERQIASMGGNSGNITHLEYAPALQSLGYVLTGSIGTSTAPTHILNDDNITNLFQFGIPSFACLATDTAFAALPMGTTLKAQQMICPPASWGSTSANQRYGLSTVETAGTTGFLNHNLMTCSNGGSGPNGNCASTDSVTITATSCPVNSHTLTVTTTTWPVTPLVGWTIDMFGTTPVNTSEDLNGISGSGTTAIVTTASATGFTAQWYCGAGWSNASDTGTALPSMRDQLGVGQLVGFTGFESNTRVNSVNSFNPASIQISTQNAWGAVSSPVLISYTAPVLNAEMQLPVKVAAPSSTKFPWIQGDILWNSAAGPGATPGWQYITAVGSYTPVLSGGTVTSVTVNNGGGPWADTPTCLFTGPLDTGSVMPTCTATVSAGVITVITPSGGSGLLAVPGVQLSTKGTWQTLGAVEGTITSGVGLWGTSAISTVLASTKAIFAGHFTNIQVQTALGGTCSTLPQFNVFDGASNTGTAVTASASTQTKGTASIQAQTLTFAAGDQIGIYISTAGGTCTTDQFTVTAEYSIP